MASMTYHVFLSFGEDTRKTFSDHLYAGLLGAGFRTFPDDNGGIERGENIKSELNKTINKARSSIIVFSKGYASSKRCLEELVMILKHKKTPSGAGHVVLPVFYDVDPSQVRKQSGSFGEALEAFIKHEEQLKAETNERTDECLWKEVQEWRTALREVADLAGMVLQNQADGHESKFIQDIVREIGSKVERPVLKIADNLVGIQSRAKIINSWLRDESNVGIAVIYGMGGIGKTTLAQYVYNLNTKRFEASSFLANIREDSKAPRGLVRLQKQLLSDILNRHEKIWNVDEGIRKIKDVISCKRILVVLDDVDDRAQFDALIEKRDWFHPGSKIILTTRNIHLWKANEIDKKYEVKELCFDKSLQLFSLHAFGQSDPIEGYNELSEKVVQHCGGLPLALKVLGSSLHGQSTDVWEGTLRKLVAIPNSEISKKLRISYDYLDYCDKELFLHVACFFIGKGKDFIVRILGDHLHPTVGIQTLIGRSLLTINGDNKLMMHQLLRQMGVEIVCQESLEEPGKRSRLCDSKDSFQVLSKKTGTETIMGLYLDMHHLVEEDSSPVLDKDNLFRENFGVGNIKCPRIQELNQESLFAEQGHSSKRHRLSSSFWCPTKNLGQSSYCVELTTDAFTRMHNLKLLQLSNVEIEGRYTDFPRGLRYLSWHGFHLTSIPAEFSLERLVDLDMRYSKLEQVWKGKMFLTSLKILNFSHSHGLKSTPEFTGLPNLEELVLEYCISLTEVHRTIGELKSLVLLNLKGCKNLKKLPCEIVILTSLETFILSGCSKLDQLPGEIKQMKSIKVLQADGIFEDIGKDRSWTSRIWSLVLRKSPKMLPCLPGSLVQLRLKNCRLNSSDDLGNCLAGLSVLKTLDLSNNPISSLPKSIKGLTTLKSLTLCDCTNLQSLPELPTKKKDSFDLSLDLDGCSLLETMTNLPNLFKNIFCHLSMRGTKVVEVQGVFKLEDIRNADAEIINKLGLLSSELETMGSLEMEYTCNKLEDYCIEKPVQVLYECGIYSIFLPRSDFPASWSSIDKRMGSSIKFIVSTLSNLKIQALKIYVGFEFCYDGNKGFHWFDYITVNNVTKGLKWAYTPWFEGLCLDSVWLSHWKIGDQITLEAGDEVTVSAGFRHHSFLVKEIGVEVVYDEVEEDVSKHHKATSPGQNDEPEEVIVSPYQLIPGYYHLCHYGDHFKYQKYKEARPKEREEYMFRESEDGDRETDDVEEFEDTDNGSDDLEESEDTDYGSDNVEESEDSDYGSDHYGSDDVGESEDTDNGSDDVDECNNDRKSTTYKEEWQRKDKEFKKHQ